MRRLSPAQLRETRVSCVCKTQNIVSFIVTVSFAKQPYKRDDILCFAHTRDSCLAQLCGRQASHSRVSVFAHTRDSSLTCFAHTRHSCLAQLSHTHRLLCDFLVCGTVDTPVSGVPLVCVTLVCVTLVCVTLVCVTLVCVTLVCVTLVCVTLVWASCARKSGHTSLTHTDSYVCGCYRRIMSSPDNQD